jgi:class 3 adenylate cyclase
MPKFKKLLNEAIVPLSVAVLATALAVTVTHTIAFLTQAELFVGDLRIATLLPPEPQDPNIVIAAVNEDTLQLFPYRSPIDRAFLANLLRALEQRQPRAIAMDVLLDQPTEPAKDDLLKDTIANLKVPIVVSYTSNPEIVNKKQLTYLNNFVPPPDRVAAEIASDTFGTARWILPDVKQSDGSTMLSFARGLLAKVGIQTPANQPEMVWHGRPDAQTTPFRMFPAHLVPVLPADWIRGKFVLIGEVESLTDRHRTPYSSVFSGNEGSLPGIEIHANAVAQLLEHSPPRNLGIGVEVGVVILMALVGAGLGALQIALAARIALGVLSFAVLWVGGFVLFRYAGISIALISPSIAGGLSQWGTDMVKGRQSRRQREFIQQTFGKFVSPQVVATLVNHPEKLTLEGEARDMTFLFTDIEGFTTLSERIDSRVLSTMLNAYLDGVCNAILELDGTIDKFIGDAVFAIFNAPADQLDHAERGVKCALAIDKFSEEFRAKQHALDPPIPLGMTRIGVHSGPAVVGNFGSHTKMQYTALGDTVNTASRLEGVNKYFGTRICISEMTRTQVSDIPFRPIHLIVPKGREEPLAIFEPLDEERANAPDTMRYIEAYDLSDPGADPTTVNPRNYAKALEIFEDLLAKTPEDEKDRKVLEIHVERLREHADGPLVMHDK